MGYVMSDRVSIHLLCSNSIIREGLSHILADRGFHILQGRTVREELTPINDRESGSTPQLILIDGGTEECDPDSIGQLKARFPQSNLVVLSDAFDFEIMLKAFRLGMHAYIVKEISCDRLAATLHLVAMGERVLPSQLADELQSRPGLRNAVEAEHLAEAARLSERERELLRWLIMGCPNKVISRHMEISEATVKVHVKALFRKLDVKNRTQAAIWAANRGIRSPCRDIEPTSTDTTRRQSPLAAAQSPAMHV